MPHNASNVVITNNKGRRSGKGMTPSKIHVHMHRLNKEHFLIKRLHNRDNTHPKRVFQQQDLSSYERVFIKILWSLSLTNWYRALKARTNHLRWKILNSRFARPVSISHWAHFLVLASSLKDLFPLHPPGQTNNTSHNLEVTYLNYDVFIIDRCKPWQ